uniref:Aerolysin-like C-terminal domain-containing protein n=1 Tax=Leptobrachium leishanense TaxID=445787 RepID=A0A8C5P928_9ANUR
MGTGAGFDPGRQSELTPSWLESPRTHCLKASSFCRFIAFAIDTTLRSIERFDFLPESAKIVSMSPDLLTSETYINESSQMLRYTFSVYKEVTQSGSFSQGHSFMVETSITFSAGIPVINVNGSVSIDTSKTETWNFTQTNEKKETFSGKSDVTVLPHSAIRVKASVTKGEILVPYRATIRTIFGNVSTILESIRRKKVLEPA